MANLFTVDGGSLSSTPAVIGAKPVGTSILIERLTTNEVLGTNKIVVDDDADYGDAPQARILAFGPLVEYERLGLKVGDRVIITGTYTELPNYDNSGRIKGILEPHCIKAVLVEAGR